MTDERFNQLLCGPLSHPLVPFHLSRLAMALRSVVEATGKAGEKALVAHCAGREYMDKIKGGEDPEEIEEIIEPAEGLPPDPVEPDFFLTGVEELDVEEEQSLCMTFDAVWTVLARYHVCDEPGGAEHRRVRQLWFSGNGPTKAAMEFIADHANRPAPPDSSGDLPT